MAQDAAPSVFGVELYAAEMAPVDVGHFVVLSQSLIEEGVI